jgi:hypothetical protein
VVVRFVSCVYFFAFTFSQLQDKHTGQILFTLKPPTSAEEIEWASALQNENRADVVQEAFASCSTKLGFVEEQLAMLQKERGDLIDEHKRQTRDLLQQVGSERNVRQQCTKTLWDILELAKETPSVPTTATAASAALDGMSSSPGGTTHLMTPLMYEKADMPLILERLLAEVKDTVVSKTHASSQLHSKDGTATTVATALETIERQHRAEVEQMENDFKLQDGVVPSFATTATSTKDDRSSALEAQLRQEKLKRQALEVMILLTREGRTVSNVSKERRKEDTAFFERCLSVPQPGIPFLPSHSLPSSPSESFFVLLLSFLSISSLRLLSIPSFLPILSNPPPPPKLLTSYMHPSSSFLLPLPPPPSFVLLLLPLPLLLNNHI